MNLQVYYKLFFIIPLVGFLLSLFVNSKRELIISRIAFFTAGTNLLALLGFLILWIYQGGNNYSCKEIILFEGTNSEFAIETYFDKISSIYLTVGSLLIFLITIYSRYYLHREQGYKRFFSTILFFYFGGLI